MAEAMAGGTPPVAGDVPARRPLEQIFAETPIGTKVQVYGKY
jgi:hypothetical protein